MLHKVEPSPTFCNNFFQLATMKFVTRQVEHAVEIRATTHLTCNATMLRDKLNKNVARITGPLGINCATVNRSGFDGFRLHNGSYEQSVKRSVSTSLET